MKTVCSINQCTGCRACEIQCPKEAIRFVDALDAVYSQIDESKCIHCGLCERVCPNLTPVFKREPILWLEGWAIDPEIRKKSSSGGIASALSKKFIEDGGYVCSCYFDRGEFSFHITNDTEEAKRFAGSKYVKSDVSTAYRSIGALLESGESVLFIGLACQVAALKNIIPPSRQEKLYCIDLICHGTPSQGLLSFFLKQHHVDISKLDDLRFRTDGQFGLSVKSIVPTGIKDRYIISFLNGLNYTEGCYRCQYASTYRVSDLTLGDNWGTEFSDELSKGLSLVLCMTEKGKKLLLDARLHLMRTDSVQAIEANEQLRQASFRQKGREILFLGIKKGWNYDRLVLALLPQKCIKEKIKCAFKR